MKRIFLFLLIFLGMTEAIFAQTRRYVDINGSPTGAATSWAFACSDLQLVINNSSSGDTIWVAQGTYLPIRPANNLAVISLNNRDNAFVLKNNVHIYGGFAGTETNLSQRNWNTNLTVLSGDIGTPNDSTDNCYHVVISAGNVGTACLDGFTITKGNANADLFDVYITVNGQIIDRRCGGGICNYHSSPAFINVTISGTVSINGGGAYNYFSSPTLTHVVISGNTAINGGGMNNEASSPILTNVNISSNTAILGGGMYIFSSSSPMLTNVTIVDNYATFSAGGICNYSASTNIRNSIIWGNTADSYASYNIGGDNNPIYSNCLVGRKPLGNGIILNEDPLFVDAANGNYRLSACSPAIEVGNNDFYSSDSLPNVSNIITDLDNNPRFYNNGIIDLGAYEYQGILQPPPFASIENDTLICYGESANIIFTLTGMPNWDIVYTKDNGITYDTLKNITTSPYILTNNYSQTTTYKLQSITNHICDEVSLSGEVTITVLPEPILDNVFSTDTLCGGEQTTPIVFFGTANQFSWTASGTVEGLPTGIQTGDFGQYLLKNETNSPLSSQINIKPYYSIGTLNCHGKDTSFSITVYPKPILTNALSNQELCDGEQTTPVIFTSTAMSTQFDWVAAGSIAGLPTGTQMGNFGTYLVNNKLNVPLSSNIVVTPKYVSGGKTCLGESQSFGIVVNPTTAMQELKYDETNFCEEDLLAFEAEVAGENIVYYWYHNNNLLVGETNKVYIVHKVNMSNSGSYYVEAQGICGNTKSQTIYVDVRSDKMLVEKWHDVILVDNSSEQYVGYQWYRDGTMIQGATNQFYQELGGLKEIGRAHV